jgi:hypothetical protein
MKSIAKLLSCLVLIAVTSGCTTMQTTYFRGSYQPLEDVNAPGLVPASGDAGFHMVSDMAQGSEDMYNKGYAMIGYSQFVSPLFTSLAPGYATKYANVIGAEYVVMETPRPGASNLHGYLATYWVRVRPDAFGIGTYASDLPEAMLDRLGHDYNVVYLSGVVPGTPADDANLKPNDVVLAVDGQRVTSTDQYSHLIKRSWGREAVISVSRYGEHLDIPVHISEPTVSSSGFSYHDEPWRNTAPTDWSMLSAANTTAMVLEQQQQQREIEAAYDRGLREANAATTYVSTNVDSAYDRYGARRGSREWRRRQVGDDGHAGYSPKDAWALEFNGAISRYEQLDFSYLEGDSLGMFFDNYTSVYGQLYSYPAGN